MSRTLFAAIVVVIVVVVFAAMWFAWRARARRDASVRTAAVAPSGAILAEFPSVLYVSTTPVGEPLTRVAATGLRYRGRSQVTVHEDGVVVEIDGESPLYFAATQLRGSASAGRRVGKAVENGGLALMRWATDERELESSFRFENKSEQRRFETALNQISHSAAAVTAAPNETSQEDAK